MADFVLAVPGDPETKTGGYVYDRRLVQALRERGNSASLLELPGDFPFPTSASVEAALGRLGGVSSGATLIVDGLAFGALPADRLAALGRPIVALVHHPLALETGLTDEQAHGLRRSERAALSKAASVVATSAATRTLLERGQDYGVDPHRLVVAAPGVDPAPRAVRSGSPPVILTVASVTPRKDHATLAHALAALTDLDWRWRIVGPLDRDPGCADGLAALIVELGLSGRTEIVGPLDDLDDAYAHADLFALASRFEGYGMVYAEALARGLPIVAGLCEAAAALVPTEAGALVEPGDVAGFADALRSLLVSPDARDAASDASWAAALALPRWKDAAAIMERVAAGLVPAAKDNGFDPAWLDLREAADHAAFAEAPLAELKRVFGARETISIVDLGAGSGSTLRFLAPKLGAHQRWLLIDDDDRVLDHARKRLGAWAETVETDSDALVLLKDGKRIEARFIRRDLAADPLPADAEGCDLVTASAFFDLVSDAWQARFVKRMSAVDAALYARLTYDGAATFHPQHPLDAAVVAAFNRHQRGDKGFGPALGPIAGPSLKDALSGFPCSDGQSPWTLRAPESALVEKLVEGMAQAASEMPDRPDGVSDWLAFRREAASHSDALANVGHVDLLFRPT